MFVEVYIWEVYIWDIFHIFHQIWYASVSLGGYCPKTTLIIQPPTIAIANLHAKLVHASRVQEQFVFSPLSDAK
jgi:hypothetical protein